MTASLFVALTIVPVLAYWFIRPSTKERAAAEADAGDAGAGRDQAEERERSGVLQRGYLATLTTALRHPVLTLGAAVLIFVGTLALVPRLETNFLGDSGQDTLTVTESFAPGTSLPAQDASAKVVEQALLGDHPGVEPEAFGGVGVQKAPGHQQLHRAPDSDEARQQPGSPHVGARQADLGEQKGDLGARRGDADAVRTRTRAAGAHRRARGGT